MNDEQNGREGRGDGQAEGINSAEAQPRTVTDTTETREHVETTGPATTESGVENDGQDGGDDGDGGDDA